MTTIVLFGGPSDERHVSVASAQNIVRALGSPLCWYWAPLGAVHDVAPAARLGHPRPFELDVLPARPAIWPDLEQALDTLPVEDPVFLLALHGTVGEDGTLQRMLERRRIPFTGSGSEASSTAFDKNRAKQLVHERVPLAESRVAHNVTEIAPMVRDMLARHERIVLKPLAGGSSRGLFFVSRDNDAQDVIDKITALGIPYIAEQFLDGRELTVGVVDRGDGPAALPVIEIEIEPGTTFDYEGKYLGKGTHEICPAKISEEMTRAAQQAGVAAHTALGCDGYSRSDFIADRDGSVYFLELNTLPGLTAASLFPQMLAEAGISFADFLNAQLALARGAAAASAAEQ